MSSIFCNLMLLILFHLEIDFHRHTRWIAFPIPIHPAARGNSRSEIYAAHSLVTVTHASQPASTLSLVAVCAAKAYLFSLLCFFLVHIQSDSLFELWLYLSFSLRESAFTSLFSFATSLITVSLETRFCFHVTKCIHINIGIYLSHTQVASRFDSLIY